MDVGAPELLVILVVVLVLFGGAQLPKLARSIGEAQREFRKGISGPPASPGTDAAGVSGVDKADDGPQTT